jgi:hypothetical protein
MHKKLEVEKLLRCGDFNRGFRRHLCEECGTVLVVPFICKSRLCLSCYRKRLFVWSLNLSHILKTGEISRHTFIPYYRFRMIWMNAVTRFLVRNKIITEAESLEIKRKYKNGFHVYFKPINGNENDLLYKTAEYLADGYFHNTQIVMVNHHRKLISFRYRSWPLFVHPCTQRHSPRPVARLSARRVRSYIKSRPWIYMNLWLPCCIFFPITIKKLSGTMEYMQ